MIAYSLPQNIFESREIYFDMKSLEGWREVFVEEEISNLRAVAVRKFVRL